MNNQKNAAETVDFAQRIEETVAYANKQAYNLLPLIDLITTEDEPKHIAESLRAIYYETAEYAVRDSNHCGNAELANNLYMLRSVVEAFESMENRDEHKIAFRFSNPANPHSGKL